MKKLPPDADAITTAFDSRYELLGPFDDWQEVCIAAALRAAALYCKRDALTLLSLADELENLNG